MDNKPQIGARVKSKIHGDIGIIEEYRNDGYPLVRWSYGNLLCSSFDNLEILETNEGNQ